MKAPKRTSISPETTEKTVESSIPSDSYEESILEKRLYERVLQSYDTHLTRRETRIRIRKFAAVWIGALLLAGGAIWSHVLRISPETTETTAVQLFSSTHSAKKISLPDSTVVILRPYSTLQITTDYNRIDRTVKLEGNAFFDVKKNKDKPFIVESKHLQTKVLGTRFSVNSPIKGNDHSIFLEEGKVRVQVDQTQQQLAPNERLVYHQNTKKWKINTMAKINLNMENGHLNLDGVDLSTLRQCLADYYQITLNQQTDRSRGIRYKITLTPQMSIQAIADLISSISMRQTIVKEQTIIIT